MTHENEEEKAQRNKAAILFLIAVLIHVIDVNIRLNGSSYPALHSTMLFVYGLFFLLAWSLFPKYQMMFLYLTIIAYLIPIINIIPGIPDEMRGTIVFFTPILPVYVAFLLAGLPVKLVTALYLIFVWTPLLAISVTLPVQELQANVDVPWAVSPGYVLERTVERISTWWFGIKKHIPTQEQIAQGQYFGESEEEVEKGEVVAQKARAYAGVLLEEIELTDEIGERMTGGKITENKKFIAQTKIKIDSPTLTVGSIICQAQETDNQQPPVTVIPEPSEIRAKNQESPVLCEFKDGLKKGLYNINISAYFYYLTVAETKQQFIQKALEQQITMKAPEYKISPGPLNIELNIPQTAAKITDLPQKIIATTKIANAWEGDIKEIAKMIYITPKGIFLEKFVGIAAKKETCETVPKEVPCYNDKMNVFSVELKKLPIERKREKEFITVLNIERDFKIGKTPETIKIILDYHYQTEKVFPYIKSQPEKKSEANT